MLRPLGIVKPDLRADNPELHCFASIFGASVLSAPTYLLATGGTVAGWGLAWLVALLGGIAFFGWCAGCVTYYAIHRLGAGGFFSRAPVAGTAFPGARPPKSRGREHGLDGGTGLHPCRCGRAGDGPSWTRCSLGSGRTRCT